MDASTRAVEYLQGITKEVDVWLDRHLPPVSDRPQRMHEAMRYSLFAGGKRLRPALAIAAYRAFGGQGDSIYLVTSALEMLHTFSLIHDDLPCMDDDDFRRGMPTAHKKFGEAHAVLSGDALCIHAFELLARTGNPQVIADLARSLGTYGMIGGQVVDIESEGLPVDLETVDYIHYHKTAALIEASLLAGARLAGACEAECSLIAEYGRAMGLAFQIVDDILDIEQTTEQLGKDAGSDVERGKATYPALLGIPESRARAERLFEQSMAALDSLPNRDTQIFRDLARFILTRVN